MQSPALTVMMVADFLLPAFDGSLAPRGGSDATFFTRHEAFDSGRMPSVPGDNVLRWRSRKSSAPSPKDTPLS